MCVFSSRLRFPGFIIVHLIPLFVVFCQAEQGGTRPHTDPMYRSVSAEAYMAPQEFSMKRRDINVSVYWTISCRHHTQETTLCKVKGHRHCQVLEMERNAGKKCEEKKRRHKECYNLQKHRFIRTYGTHLIFISSHMLMLLMQGDHEMLLFYQ